MLRREIVEKDYCRIFSEYRYGSTVWSPLQGGLLTGKYNDGTAPAGSRFEQRADFFKDTWGKYFGPEHKEKTIS